MLLADDEVERRTFRAHCLPNPEDADEDNDRCQQCKESRRAGECTQVEPPPRVCTIADRGRSLCAVVDRGQGTTSIQRAECPTRVNSPRSCRRCACVTCQSTVFSLIQSRL